MVLSEVAERLMMMSGSDSTYATECGQSAASRLNEVIATTVPAGHRQSPGRKTSSICGDGLPVRTKSVPVAGSNAGVVQAEPPPCLAASGYFARSRRSRVMSRGSGTPSAVDDRKSPSHPFDAIVFGNHRNFQRHQWSNPRGWVKLAFADQILRNDVHFCLFVSRSSDSASRKSAKRRDLTSV